MMAAQPLTPELTMVMDLVSTVCGIRFDTVLVNRYEGKDDYISPHSDDERSLAPGGVVATISLGESRAFRIRNKLTKDIIMRGQFQKEFTHDVPKDVTGGVRISLTFRYHLE